MFPSCICRECIRRGGWESNHTLSYYGGGGLGLNMLSLRGNGLDPSALEILSPPSELAAPPCSYPWLFPLSTRCLFLHSSELHFRCVICMLYDSKTGNEFQWHSKWQLYDAVTIFGYKDEFLVDMKEAPWNPSFESCSDWNYLQSSSWACMYYWRRWFLWRRNFKVHSRE